MKTRTARRWFSFPRTVGDLFRKRCCLFVGGVLVALQPLAAQDEVPVDPIAAREKIQDYLENDEARKAVATLAEASRANPKDRVLGAMMYSAIRDHIWQIPQIFPFSHPAPVRALSFSPTGNWLASGSDDGTVRLSSTEPLDEEDATAQRIEFKTDGAVLGLLFSPDGQRLAVASANGPIRVWNIVTKALEFEAPKPAAPALAFTSRREKALIAIGCEDGSVQIVDLVGNRVAGPAEKVKGKILALSFNADASRIAAATSENSVLSWRTDRWELLGPPILHRSTIRTLDFTPNGRYVASGGDDRQVKLSDPENGLSVLPPLPCGVPVKKVRISADGSRLAAMLDDSSVRFWDALTGDELPLSLREDGGFNDMLWSRTGLRMATASEANHVTVWTTLEGVRFGELLPHDAPVLFLSYSRDGRLLATGSTDGKVRVWRMDGGKPMPTVRSHSDRVRSVAYSSDGTHLLTTSDDHTALHWISGQVRPFGNALKHAGRVTCGVFDKDATRMLTSDDTGIAQLWTAATGAADGAPYKHKGPVNWVDFHPDSQRFLTVSGNAVNIWSITQRNKPLAVITHPGKGKSEMKQARFSPDGKYLATASSDGTARIWDAATYKAVGAPIERGFPMLCVRFSPDSSRLVVGGEDSQAIVYDTATWKPVGTPVLLPGPVFSAIITEDNLFIATSAFLLNAVQFYEISTGRALGQGLGVPSQATCVDYLLQDKVIVVACDDGTARAFGSPFVGQDIPSWTCDFAERIIGLRKTGPDAFERMESHVGQLRNYLSTAVRSSNFDFPKLVTWKMTLGAERVGFPRFLSTLAANIERRIDERSLEALFECYEAAPGDALVLAALSTYLPNPQQREFLADVVLARGESDPLTRAFAAGTLIAAGRSEEATKIMDAAVAAAPENPKVLRRAAKLDARLSRKTEAIEHFEASLKLEPNDAETRRSYAWALYNLNEPEKAAEQFRLAQDLLGDVNSDLIAGLCLCAAAQKNTKDATSAFRRLATLDPAWKEAAYIAALPGWTPRELAELERLRAVIFPARK